MTAKSPAMAPVWDWAAARARSLRPGCIRITGLPARRAAAAAVRKAPGLRMVSAKRTKRSAASVSTRCAKRSSTPITASLPVETESAMLRPRAASDRRMAPARAPLWARMAVRGPGAGASGNTGSKVRGQRAA